MSAMPVWTIQYLINMSRVDRVESQDSYLFINLEKKILSGFRECIFTK